MSLEAWLSPAFLAFCVVLAIVFAVAVRERRAWHNLATGEDIDGTAEAGEASDLRVAVVIFGGIIMGALLALLVGYLVFFSDLATV